MIPLVYLDTNIFVAAFESEGRTADDAWLVMAAIEAGRLAAATSELTLAELLSKPPSSVALIADYEQMIRPKPGLKVQVVTRTVLLEAAAIRRGRASLKLPDAIHLATAKLVDSDVFLTSDIRLQASEQDKVVLLGPRSLDEIVAMIGP